MERMMRLLNHEMMRIIFVCLLLIAIFDDQICFS